MNRRLILWIWLAVVAVFVTAGSCYGDMVVTADTGSGPFENEPMDGNYGRLPLRFEINKGQAPAHIDYIAHGPGYVLALSSTESVVLLAGDGKKAQHGTVRMTFVGADPNARGAAYDGLQGTAHYFVGKNPAKWYVNIATYGAVRYENVYPGVDVVYYGNGGRLEYDFVLSPGSNPADITLSFDGIVKNSGRKSVRIDETGDLILVTDTGDLRLRRPVTYQEVEGTRRYVEAAYSLKSSQEVTVEVGEYDATRPLVIDPVLVYATYLGGGSDDYGYDVTVDGSGNAYITGYTLSLDFLMAGEPPNAEHGMENAFVSKLDPSGSELIFSTYIGGADDDDAYAIEVNEAGNAYIAGETWSADFPTTDGAMLPFSETGGGFVSKLSADGSTLLYSTYIGVSVYDIALDVSGNVYFAGNTETWDFQETTANAPYIQPSSLLDAFIGKLDMEGSVLVYGTYLGASQDDIAYSIDVDGVGNAFVAGTTKSPDFPTTDGVVQDVFANERGTGMGDAFVAKIDPTGTRFVYVTFLGGSADDEGMDVASAGKGETFVTGSAYSADFPTTSGVAQPVKAAGSDLFVAKLNAAGTALVYSTYIGGFSDDFGMRCAADGDGHIYVTGNTVSEDFPTTAGAAQSSAGGRKDAIVARLDASGTELLYGTYVGGTSDDEGTGVAVDGSGNVYLTGITGSGDFPVTSMPIQSVNAGGNLDAFVAEIDTDAEAAVSPVISGIEPMEGPDDGGTDVFITGTGFDETAEVYFGETPASMTYFNSATELRAVTPSHVPGTVDVTVNQRGGSHSLARAYTYLSPTFTVSGAVQLTGGGIVENPFVMVLSGDDDRIWNWQCDSSGVCEYSFPDLDPGTYTVTPVLDNYTFDPPTRHYGPLTQSVADQDFVGTPTIKPIAVTSIEPDKGPEGDGMEVTVSGDFFPALGRARLTVGSSVARVMAVKNPHAPYSLLTAVLPPHFVDVNTTVDVVVTDLITGEQGRLANSFTYVAAPLTAPVVDDPPPFINADRFVVTGTAEPGSFVIVGGGLYPAHQQLAKNATEFAISLMLRQNAVNVLSVAVVDASGARSEPVFLRIVERDTFPAGVTQVTGLTIDSSPPTTISLLSYYSQFRCFAEFAGGSPADVTEFVEWIVDAGGSMTANGLYINDGIGSSEVRAGFGDVLSQPVVMSDIAGKQLVPNKQLASGLLKGVVKNAYSGLGLENGAAHVAAYPAGFGTVETESDTFEYGNYVLLLPEKLYDIESTAAGFQTSTVSDYEFHVTVPTPMLDFDMTPEDTGPPEVEIVQPETGDTVTGTSVAVTAIVYDQYSDIDEAVLTINGGDATDIAGEITEQGYFRGSIPVPEGDVTIRVEATDTAGNPQSSSEVTFAVEKQYVAEGDVNGDYKTNAIDVQLVINSVLGLDIPFDTDINGDGFVNAQDIQMVINAVLAVG